MLPARVRALLRPAACLAAGVLAWTSFPPLSLWWAAVPAVATLLVAVRARSAGRGALLGLCFGLGLLVPTMSFLRGLGVDAWLVVAGLESLWFALLGAAVAIVSRRSWWPVAAAPLWIAMEWVRDRWPFGGFPWARLAFGQANGPLLRLAAWGGAPLVATVVVALSAVLAWSVAEIMARRRSWWRLAAPMAVVGVVAAASASVAVPTRGTTRGGPSHVVVAAVQGNVPRLGLDPFTQRRVVTTNHAEATTRLAADIAAGSVARPALVIWPENASDADPYVDPIAYRLIDDAVRAVGVPVVVGAVINGPGPHHVRNVAIVWSPQTGPGERYVKRHLVPFGEYLPFRSVLTRLVGRFSLIPRDFLPGDRPGVLTAGDVRLADVICFEVADDGVVRDAVDGGGRLLVVQTNNASYEHRGDSGHGGETAQQLAMSQLRAVEHGRAVVVVATSGVSAVIAPSGRVLQRTGVFTPATLVADVPLRDGRTVADRLGAWPERVLAALGALALLTAAWRPRRRAATDPGEPARPAAELAAQP